MERDIILASASPRRRELLQRMGLSFRVQADPTDETADAAAAPWELVQQLAEKKARKVAAQQNGPALVIGADTVVVLDGRVLGKPHDAAEAAEMLNALSGRTHSVFTGYFVLDTADGKHTGGYEKTDVTFRPLTQEEIEAYLRTGEPMDKAGAYGIQEYGALFVERIAGDYFNVVGLPVCKLGQILTAEFGVSLLPDGR